jgi:glucose-1-phosphate thymidylyltransferase
LKKIKAIIPVAGVGTRLRPHTYTQPKPLIPVAGKPIISFIIDELKLAGITDFVFVIGYLGEKIKNYVEDAYPNINAQFVLQEDREGLGHAIWTARNVVHDTKEILIVLGDTVFDMNLSSMLKNPHSCLGVKEVKDPREFGVVELDAEGFIRRVMEKPKIPKSNLALVGLYRIKEVGQLMDALSYNIEHDVRTMGEFQLADGLMRMIASGVKMGTVPVNNWFDCGKKEILLETNQMLLEKKGYTPEDDPTLDNTIVVHPVSIGHGCKITNSIIGPYVSIGEYSVIQSSIVKDSIIGTYSVLDNVVLHHSVIGSDTAIKGPQKSLSIGDNTEIDFS